MREADIADVSELLQECYRWLGKREGFTAPQTDFLLTKRGSPEVVRRESEAQDYMVAEDGGEIVGMVAVSMDTITKLYVRPDLFGTGIGRQLYEAAEALIRSTRQPRVFLGAFPSAVPFYQHMGLEVVGSKVVTGAMAGVVVTLMEKDLKTPT
jgi:N-acetylglutamate synthase-like GNAT family acetyltransferase